MPRFDLIVEVRGCKLLSISVMRKPCFRALSPSALPVLKYCNLTVQRPYTLNRFHVYVSLFPQWKSTDNECSEFGNVRRDISRSWGLSGNSDSFKKYFQVKPLVGLHDWDVKVPHLSSHSQSADSVNWRDDLSFFADCMDINLANQVDFRFRFSKFEPCTPPPSRIAPHGSWPLLGFPIWRSHSVYNSASVSLDQPSGRANL